MLGVDVEALCAACGLDRAELDGEDVRIPERVVLRLWDELEARTGDALIGLHVAEQLAASGRWGLLEYAVKSCASFDDAWTRVKKLLPLAFRGADEIVDIEDEQGTRTVGYRRLPGGNPLVVASEDCVVASFALACRAALASPFRPTGVFFQRARPRGGDAEHRRVFDAPVTFEALFNGLSVDAATRRAPMKAHDPNLLALLDQLADTRLAALGKETPSFAEMLGRWIERRIDAGASFSIEDAAQAFHTSVRSLQRKLEGDDVTFRSLVDETRKRIALARVNDANAKEIAAQLGFSDTTQLYRAFKRWTGTSLAEQRRRIARDPRDE